MNCLVPKSCPYDTTLPFCWQPGWLTDIWNVSPDTMELVNCKKSKNLGCLCNDARASLSCLRLLGHRRFAAKIVLCALLLLCFLIGGISLMFQARYPVSQSGRRCGETFSQQLRQHMDRRCGTVRGGGGADPAKPWWEVALYVGGVETCVWFEITHNRNSWSQKTFFLLCCLLLREHFLQPDLRFMENGDIFIPRPGLQCCWYDFGGLLQLFLGSRINQEVVRAEFLLSGGQNMTV